MCEAIITMAGTLTARFSNWVAMPRQCFKRGTHRFTRFAVRKCLDRIRLCAWRPPLRHLVAALGEEASNAATAHLHSATWIAVAPAGIDRS
jgi:hypothetical protein